MKSLAKVFAAVCMIGLVGCGSNGVSHLTLDDASGQALYQAKCQKCHSPQRAIK